MVSVPYCCVLVTHAFESRPSSVVLQQYWPLWDVRGVSSIMMLILLILISSALKTPFILCQRLPPGQVPLLMTDHDLIQKTNLLIRGEHADQLRSLMQFWVWKTLWVAAMAVMQFVEPHKQHGAVWADNQAIPIFNIDILNWEEHQL